MPASLVRELAAALTLSFAMLALVAPVSAATVGSDPEQLTRVGNMLFFSAQGPGGRELWKSDGTAGGTARVKNIQPGGAGSKPQDLVDVDGTLFFNAFDGINWGLWTSDGTGVGTNIVDYIDADELTSFAGMLFFKGPGGLWSSDGTPEGTNLVKAIAGGCCYLAITELEVVNNWLYFSAVPGENGADNELWRSDGTTEGTTLVDTVNHLGSSLGIHTLTRAGNRLFFLRDTENNVISVTNAHDLWTSDGTAAGTRRVKNFVPDDVDNVHGLMAAQQKAFFSVEGALWKSRGPGNTTMVHDFAPDGVTPIGKVGNTVFLSAAGALWTSDGTDAGTDFVEAVEPYQLPLCFGDPCPVERDYTPVAAGGALYFASESGGLGIELYRSDGTAAGTDMLMDINPGTKGSRPADLTRVGDLVLFSAKDATHGRELWVTDGTGPGTELVMP